MRHYSGSRPQARRKAGAEARSKGKTPGASPDPRRGDRRRSSGIQARLVRKPRRIIRPGPVQGARHGKTAGGRAKRLRAARPPHATPTSIQSIFGGRIDASDRWRALKTPTAQRQSAPRGQNNIETKPRQRGRIQGGPTVRFPRRFLSPPPSHRLRPDPRPFCPPPWPMRFARSRASDGGASKRNAFRPSSAL